MSIASKLTNHESHIKKIQKSRKNRIVATNQELRNATSPITHRMWTRTFIILSVITVVYFYTKNQNHETKFGLVRENLLLRMQKFECASSYAEEIQAFPECVPNKCGRFITDKLIEAAEGEILLDLARSILTKYNSSGGASVLDLHTGALSFGEGFINAYDIEDLKDAFKEEHFNVFNLVRRKIKRAIAEHFGISNANLYFTYPTFFSRLTNITAKTVHDEYWHEHVDKETYESFHYTSLLYLTTYKKDFGGGRFVFVDGTHKNRTTSIIEPKLGRVSGFTSGEDNRHHVEIVTKGERYALTISFTCDPKLGIPEPRE
ncbi:2-oxoglutarate and iron-dependent oxygenase domain-containing protein 3-like [Teleopsis dalmanni]|uniref:2-oxoglutarate and iron-dependent oxygenase domain-containing protein 3-like n=1 Tax=Teleopsis dalmanni TaxID=139649 RepID=UPI0018CE2CF8|nr:2-oxoglutarate and iron-dependent oxygenase domain-containing protein 3-like [Teleopsis dalmanni]